MDLITLIVLFLLLSPFFAVFTDFKTWKIKNYFIFPSLLISFILTFFIQDFYSNINNVIWLLIVVFFWYLFYINNKWWAGDGKYIMLIWLNSLIISHILWFDINIINSVFTNIFGILFIYTLFFILINIKKISKIKFDYTFNTKLIDSLYIIFFIYIVSYLLSRYIWTQYIYILIFLSITLLIPFLLLIKNKYIKYLIILSWVTIGITYMDYISISLIWGIFFVFMFLQSFSEQIFNIIDVKQIKLFELKQWSILTKNTLDKIKDDTWLDFHEAPLQWDEVFELIWKYKELWENPKLTIYKDLKIWIIMYIWYILTIFINM